MTFTIGSWAIPAAVTVIAIGSVFIPDRSPRFDYDFSGAIVGALHLAGSVIIALVAWLVWALLA